MNSFSKLNIYYPDVLDAASMLDGISNNYSFYKDSLHSFDENTAFKTKLFLGIAKVIELAHVFSCVYLDKTEFLRILNLLQDF